MKENIKSLFKKTIRSAGYDLQRRSSTIFPYRRTIDFCGHQFEFWIADEVGRLWYEEVLHHMNLEASEILKMVKPGERVLEVGCHHGFFTILLAQTVGQSGFVCAVEASPENAMTAQAQITLNNLGNHSAVLHRAGSDSAAPVNMMHGSHGGNSRVVTESEPAVQVDTVTGDELDQKYGPFDFLKLDVEGFETKVLRGCKNVLARRPKIAIEIHPADLPHYGSSPSEVMELLNLQDYEGTMLKRPDYSAVQPLKRDSVSGAEPVNLFLWPKRK